MSTDGSERRRRTRTPLHNEEQVSLSFEDPSGSRRSLFARLIDVSGEGLGIELAAPLEVGSSIAVKGKSLGRSSGDKPVFHAKVCWCLSRQDGSYRAGLSFEDPASGEPFGKAKSASTSPISPVSDYYEILQLSRNAAPDTIHRVYRILAQRHHPDNPDSGDQEAFKLVLDAYRVLSDPEQRAAYDVQLGAYQRAKWKIFDQPQAARGVEAEKRKRQGILSLLYTKRMNEPEHPHLTIQELEDLLGCPREHLQFSLWYLKENAWAVRTDNGRYMITVKGVDQAEAAGVPWLADNRLLTDGREPAC